MPSITLLVPTRSRPHRFWHAVSSARNLASERIEVISYLDEDDPKLSEYPEYHIVGRRVGTAKAILAMLEQRAPQTQQPADGEPAPQQRQTRAPIDPAQAELNRSILGAIEERQSEIRRESGDEDLYGDSGVA